MSKGASIEFLATDPARPCRDEEDRKHTGMDIRLEVASRIMATIVRRDERPALKAAAVFAVDAADALIMEWADRGGLL